MSEQTPPTSTDTPIDGSEETPDLLDRDRFAKQVAARIISAGTGDSVVFGLSGSWGAGKTSALKMIRRALLDTESEWIVVDFTPWSANDPYAVAEEFYRTIASNLPEDKGATARHLLNRAAPALAAGAKVILKGLAERYMGDGTMEKAIVAMSEEATDTAGDLQFDEDPFSKRFEKIRTELAALNVRMLVIVDDIDRLHHDELLAVMKAVRLLGRFGGVHYLLSYDIQTVTDVLARSDLAHRNQRRAEQYLEKIVQYPFELPPIQHFHLRREFLRQLQALADRTGFALHPQFDDGKLPGDVILDQLPADSLTLRTVHRLITQVDMLFALIVDTSDKTSRASTEINLVDAVLLTYLRLEYPQLYRSLRNWKGELTRTRQRSHEEDVAATEEWRERIAKIVDPHDANAAASRDAYAVLRAMFPISIPHPRDDYRTTPSHAAFQIRSRDYFERYFAFGIPAADIRDAALRAELVELASTGKLPENSLIARHADNPDTARLLRSKIAVNAENAYGGVDDLSHCDDAAIALARIVPEHELIRPLTNSWWAIGVFVLWRAIDNKLGEEATRAAITNYIDEVGCETAVTALATGKDLIEPGSSMWKASEPVRHRVRDEIIAVLLGETLPHSPNPVQRYWHWAAQQPGLIEQVSTTVQDRWNNEGELDLIGIAARLISLSNQNFDGTQQLQSLDIALLEKILPRDIWPNEQIPTALTVGVDLTDLSPENIRRHAANCLYISLQDHRQPIETV